MLCPATMLGVMLAISPAPKAAPSPLLSSTPLDGQSELAQIARALLPTQKDQRRHSQRQQP